MRSIRATLLLWLFSGLSAAVLLAALLVYQRASEEANRLFDVQMQTLAQALPRGGLAALGDAGNMMMGSEWLIQWWDLASLEAGRPGPGQAAQGAGLPLMPPGFASVAGPGGRWRTYTEVMPGGVLQIAQPQSVRSERATQSALRSVMPMLALFPLLGVLAWIGVSAGLLPMRRLSRELGRRSAHDLQPLPERGLPAEILPLTGALNQLLQQLQESMQAQRAFVADAAHELRTPLTALKLQIQLARRAPDAQAREDAMQALDAAFSRVTHLVQQLLLLARQEPGAQRAAAAPVDLARLTAELEQDYPDVVAKGVLQLRPQGALTVMGDEDGLRAMLRSLVDNALLHAGGQGPVEVGLVGLQEQGGDALLWVQDQGPGIPPSELARVFDRFYRGAEVVAEGTGLGLAIAQRVAQRHGGDITLANTEPGLRATVRLPRLAAGTA